MAEIAKEKVTMMKLTVDLECSKCYKKVKRVLCKFPQIRDIIFDEKSNAVIIKVVCCSPEKIMDKLCCEGGGSIKTIEIIEPPSPTQGQAQPKRKPKPNPNPIDEPPVGKPVPVPVPGPPQPPPVMPRERPGATCCGQCYEGHGGGPCFNGYGMAPQPSECYGRPVMPLGRPGATCCAQCYEGHGGGPCYGRPVCESWGGGPPCNRYCHVTRCDCLSEDNPQNCSIM